MSAMQAPGSLSLSVKPLQGSDGDDTLGGSAGGDILDGGRGNDTYLFGRGAGQDTIEAHDPTVGKQEAIALGADLTPADLLLRRVGDALVLSIQGAPDTLTVEGFFLGDASLGYQIEQIRFANGDSWDLETMKAMALAGGDSADTLEGYADANPLAGLDGDDVAIGNGGEDTLDGGRGNDLLDGGAGNDTYLFGRGAGNDTIRSYDPARGKYDLLRLGDDVDVADVRVARFGDDLQLILNSGEMLTVENHFVGAALAGYQIDAIEFAGGTVWDTGSIDDMLRSGGDGDDTLDGVRFDGTLRGGAGNDTYLFGRGSGEVSIEDLVGDEFNVVRIASDVTPAEVVVERRDAMVYLGIVGSAARLRFFCGEDGLQWPVQLIEFADGTRWTPQAPPELHVQGVGGQSILHGLNGADTLDATAGGSEVFGWGGNDLLRGGASTIYMAGGMGDDTLDPGVAGIDGGVMMAGGTGRDTYLFGRGSGQVSINSNPNEDDDGAVDVVQLGAGLSAADVVLQNRGGNLVLSLVGSDDALEVVDLFREYLPAAGFAVDLLRFADTTEWDIEEIRSRLVPWVENGRQRIQGDERDQYLAGSGGADLIVAGGGVDTLDGGAGADELLGDEGDDVYVFGRGYGEDRILYENKGSPLGTDIVRLTADVTPDDVILQRSGRDDLVLSILGTDDRLTIGLGMSDASWVKEIHFADDTVWDALPSRVVVDNALDNYFDENGHLDPAPWDGILDGGAGNDTLEGTSRPTRYLGGSGDDFLQAGRRDDTLDGGAGDDRMLGGAGHDTYLFGRGSGKDVIAEWDSRAETIRLDAGVAPADVILNRLADGGMMLRIAGTDDVLRTRILGVAGAPSELQIVFADDTVWDRAEIEARYSLAGTVYDDALVGGTADDDLAGLADDDLLRGGGGDDTLDGGAGGDTLDGGAGSNVFRFGRGAGQDWIVAEESAGLGIVEFGPGIAPEDLVFLPQTSDWLRELRIGGGDEVLRFSRDAFTQLATFRFAGGAEWDAAEIRRRAMAGSAGNDRIHGSDEVEALVGGAGGDSLYGHGGDDTLDGGVGNDVLDGGPGRDTYLFGRGSGRDTVSGLPGDVEIVELAPDLRPEDLRFSYVDEFGVGTLCMQIVGTDDALLFKVDYMIEAVRFGDGFELTLDTIQNLARAPDEGDDWVDGRWQTGAVLAGGGGNDTLLGDYDEVMDGGAGDDLLYTDKGSGTATYLFGRGDGHDRIELYYEGQPDLQIVQLKPGLSPLDVVVARHGDGSLLLSLPETGDQIVLNAFFWTRTEIRFEDGTVWDRNYLADIGEAPVPVLAQALPDAVAMEDRIFKYTIPTTSFVDAEVDDPLKLSACLADDSPLPDWLQFHEASRTFAGTPRNGDVGSWAVRVIATDKWGYTVSDVFDINVGNVNDAPVAALTLADAVIDEDAPFSYVVPADAFVDVDPADVLAYDARLASGDPLPAWLVFDAASLSFSGTPTNADVGMLDLVVTVTDAAGASATSAFRLTIENVNDAPVVTVAVPDQQGKEGVAFRQVLASDTFSDEDLGDSLALTAMLADGSALPSWLAFDAASRTFSGTPPTGSAGTLAIRVTATDRAGASASDSFDLAIAPGITIVNGSSTADRLTGTGGEDKLYGLAGKDTLSGGAGDDSLDGGSGDDSLSGGAGNDIYVVDSSNDKVVENAGEGEDRILASVSYALGSNVEHLTLTGSAAINATGNAQDNRLSGNSGANKLNGAAGNDTLDGGAGKDSLSGGAGDDTYYVDNAGDTVTENSNEGDDLVYASVGYSLGSNLERLTLTGNAALNGTGNSLNNALTGNAGANLLSGAAGNDTLDGGADGDTLDGGSGNDTYRLLRGGGADRVSDNDSVTGSMDVIETGSNVAADQLWFSRSGNDLRVDIIGGGDGMTVANWFLGGRYRIERFRSGDGKTLRDTQVDALVTAMSAFTPPAAGETELRPAYHAALDATLAANWR